MFPPNSIRIDPYSAATTPLKMFFNQTPLSDGTGFFWIENGRVLLVTNWHNVTGINPLTDQHISSTGAEPNRIEFDIFEKGDLNQRRTRSVPLYADDSPRWTEHPLWGRQVDAVCLPLEVAQNEVFSINTLPSQPLIPLVGNDAFVLGYPGAIHTQRLPIWKRASIATEPDVDVDGKPLFFVDTASTSGMSGSPVVVRSTTGDLETGGSIMAGPVMTRFIGIYSGRVIASGSVEAQLGRVFKAKAVEAIAKYGQPGKIR